MDLTRKTTGFMVWSANDSDQPAIEIKGEFVFENYDAQMQFEEKVREAMTYVYNGSPLEVEVETFESMEGAAAADAKYND